MSLRSPAPLSLLGRPTGDLAKGRRSRAVRSKGQVPLAAVAVVHRDAAASGTTGRPGSGLGEALDIAIWLIDKLESHGATSVHGPRVVQPTKGELQCGTGLTAWRTPEGVAAWPLFCQRWSCPRCRVHRIAELVERAHRAYADQQAHLLVVDAQRADTVGKAICRATSGTVRRANLRFGPVDLILTDVGPPRTTVGLRASRVLHGELVPSVVDRVLSELQLDGRYGAGRQGALPVSTSRNFPRIPRRPGRHQRIATFESSEAYERFRKHLDVLIAEAREQDPAVPSDILLLRRDYPDLYESIETAAVEEAKGVGW